MIMKVPSVIISGLYTASLNMYITVVWKIKNFTQILYELSYQVTNYS